MAHYTVTENRTSYYLHEAEDLLEKKAHISVEDWNELKHGFMQDWAGEVEHYNKEWFLIFLTFMTFLRGGECTLEARYVYRNDNMFPSIGDRAVIWSDKEKSCYDFGTAHHNWEHFRDDPYIIFLWCGKRQ